MNAVLSLSHFCETHGPSILFSTQAFHFAGDVHCGILKPSGVQFFGCLTKLGESIAGKSPNVNNRSCEACESVSGYITNDYENKISFLSTRLAIDSNVSSLLKQAAVRSLSCEVVPGKEGQVYFGDSVRGHVLSNTFFLKDSQARGFHRWYSIVVFMKDKHFLLNSWSFFHQHINQIVLHLQRQATQVYSNEQSACSQRALRLSFLDQKHSSARSLMKLTASTNVFAQLHLWFSWLLSIGAKRLEEHLPKQILDSKSQEREAERYDSLKKKEASEEDSKEEDIIYHLKQLRHIFGPYNFQKLLYSTLIGRQVVVRGPKIIVEAIINSLKLFLPAGKFCCQKFGNTYKTPDICNIIGLDLSAAVPKSSNSILRLDIVPLQEIGTTTMTELDAIYKFHNFIVKNDSELPEKLPSLLVKIDKCLSDENLSNRVVWLHIKSLMEQWFHVAKVVRELKKKESEVYITSGVMQSLGVQEQDNQLIEFWTS